MIIRSLNARFLDQDSETPVLIPGSPIGGGPPTRDFKILGQNGLAWLNCIVPRSTLPQR